VAPGAVGRFDVALDADAIGDTEIELGLVEESVTWFADATLGGGPPDGFLKVHLVVVAEDAPLDAGAVEDDAGEHERDAGGSPVHGQDGGGIDQGASDGGAGNGAAAGGSAGCSLGVPGGDGAPWASGLGVVLVLGGLRRRRRG
jgi:hypothetical protein